MTRSRIGPLALESPLGGPGARVFRAVHIQKRLQVAVRVFSIPMGMTPEAKQEFADQLESLKLLRHPNIVRCFGGGFDAKDAYLVHELVDGESLDQALERRERLPWESVLEYGLKLCEALQVVHQSGWIHGRIRPDKILVESSTEQVKLNDIRRGPGAMEPLTADQLAYCAPESFADVPKSDVATDLYSVGAVLYHALTGQPPYSGPNATLVKQAIHDASLAPVASIVFDCPVWLSAIVEQMLSKDSLKRPYTAAAASMALREAQKRASEGGSVAQHVVSGFSPLQLNTNRAEAEKALGHKKKKRKRDDDEQIDAPSLWERPMVLVGLLAATIGVITFLCWPLSERTLYDRADRLLKQDDVIEWNRARDEYLIPMLERFPTGKYAEWAEEKLEEIEMRNAEDKMRRTMRLGREPSSEGERKYMEALRFEAFGDRVTALDKYKGIVNLLKDVEKERPYVNLSKRQIAKLESDPPTVEELRKFLQEKLAEADQLYKDGDVIRARQIWDGIVSLYNGNQEMVTVVEQAQSRLDRNKGS